MLSIRFDDHHEWWTSADVFDRLFTSALERGDIAAELAEWQLVANANGGMTLNNEPKVAEALSRGLRASATAELALYRNHELSAADTSYVVALEKVLRLFDGT